MSNQVLNEEQKAFLENQMKPCPPSVAIEYLDWLSAHKRMENDPARMTVLKRDYAEILSGAPEYAVVLTVIWLIQENDSSWWPTLAEIERKVQEFMVPMQPRPGDTNIVPLVKDRLGAAIASSWFSQCVLEERTLYTASKFVAEWITNNYLSQLRDIFDTVETVKELK